MKVTTKNASFDSLRGIANRVQGVPGAGAYGGTVGLDHFRDLAEMVTTRSDVNK